MSALLATIATAKSDGGDDRGNSFDQTKNQNQPDENVQVEWATFTDETAAADTQESWFSDSKPVALATQEIHGAGALLCVSSSSEDDCSTDTSSDGSERQDLVPDRQSVLSKSSNYDVEFPDGKVDITFETDWDGKTKFVKSFVRNEKGEHGHGRESGKIELNDMLVAVDEVDITKEDFSDTLKRFKNAEGQGQKIVLTFRNPSGDGGIAFNEDNNPLMKTAMREIHDYKVQFYKNNTEFDVRKCYVQVYEGDFLTSFHLHLEADDSFICAASCTDDMSSGFVFHTLSEMTWESSMKDIPIDPRAHAFLGQMVPNFVGTKFTIHDYRVMDPSQKDAGIYELGHIVYEMNIVGRVPNSLQAFLPRYDERFMEQKQTQTIAERISVQDSKHDDLDKTLVDTLMMKEDHKYSGIEVHEQAQLISLRTKKPIWSSKHESWCLDFGGRVRRASKKNFMLVVEPGREDLEEEFGANKTLLLFGKVTNERYSLDYRYPLSPVQALGIALTTFASKLAVV